MTDRPLPTDAELAILTVLWRRGPSTVRDIHEALRASQSTGYTTVLKLLQIMTQKGLVKRDKTQKRMLGDLLDKAFSGSAHDLVMRALSLKPASREELAAIRALLDEAERKEHKS